MVDRRHHYVPQFYLKSFRIKEKGNNYVFVFDKQFQKEYVSNTRKIASKNDFYRSNSQNIEKKLSQIETRIAKPFKEITIKKNLELLNKENRRTMSDFLALQYTRTKDKRKIIEDLEKFAISIDSDFNEDVVDIHLEETLNYTEFSKVFQNCLWFVIENFTECPFITSDSPVTLFNQKYEQPGIKIPLTQIYFPLSPEICLWLINPSGMDIEKYKESKEYNKELNMGICSFENKKDVHAVNVLQIYHATRQVYSNQKGIIEKNIRKCFD